MARKQVLFFMILSQVIYGMFAIYAIGAIIATLMSVAAGPPSLIGTLFIASTILYPIAYCFSVVISWGLVLWHRESLALRVAQLPAAALLFFVVCFILFFWR